MPKYNSNPSVYLNALIKKCAHLVCENMITDATMQLKEVDYYLFTVRKSVIQIKNYNIIMCVVSYYDCCIIL